MGEAVSGRKVRIARDSTRVLVLDDGHSGRLMVKSCSHGGLRIKVIVVGHLLTLEDLGDSETSAIRAGIDRSTLV